LFDESKIMWLGCYGLLLETSKLDRLILNRIEYLSFYLFQLFIRSSDIDSNI